MNLRSTLLLAAIFAALAGYLYFVELPRAADQAASEVLLDFEEEKVSRVELEHPGREIVLERQDGTWRMLKPVAAPADQRNVENLISAVAGAEVKRTLDEAGELAAYGLDVPSATIRLTAGEEQVGVIELGKQTPVGGSVYVQRNGDGVVLLTDAALAGRIDQKAADLRDKTILEFDSELVSSIAVDGAGDATAPSLRMQRDDDGNWRIVAPAEHAADTAAVRGLLSTLGSMRAIDFLDDDGEDLGRYGLDAPRRILTLGFVEGEPLELRIGNEREGMLRVQTNRRPTVYSVASWVADSIDQNADHFRDKTVASFAADDAARLEIRAADGVTLDLVKTEDGWSAADGDSAVDRPAVDEMLGELANLAGFEIAADLAATGGDLAGYGLAPPQRTIRVRDAAGDQLAAVRLGSYVADGARIEYTAADADAAAPTVFHLRQAIYQKLDRGPDELLEAAAPPVDVPAGASEGAATPVPDGEPGDGVDENALDDAAAAGE